MKGKMLVGSLLLFLLSATLIGGIWAQTYAPGVAEGDSFTYDVTGFWNSNDPSVTIPQSFLEINETDYYEINITGIISGAEIIAYTTWHFKNGSEAPAVRNVNVETGAGSGQLLILAANLNANDRIHPSGQDTITINETVVRNYLGEDRETNHLMFTYQENGSSGTLDRYFDRETGMLVELREETLYVDPDATIIVSWKIKGTSVWGNPMEIPWLLIIPILVVIAVIIGVLFFIRKKRKRKKH